MRISGKGGSEGVGVRFAYFISFFLNFSCLTYTKLFHFHRKFKNGGRGGVFKMDKLFFFFTKATTCGYL